MWRAGVGSHAPSIAAIHVGGLAFGRDAATLAIAHYGAVTFLAGEW